MYRRLTNRKVTYDVWLENNEDYLHEVYTMIQEANDTTGRHVFDAHTCAFASFCKLAYEHSYIYTTNDAWMYEPESDDEDSHAYEDKA